MTDDQGSIEIPETCTRIGCELADVDHCVDECADLPRSKHLGLWR